MFFFKIDFKNCTGTAMTAWTAWTAWTGKISRTVLEKKIL